MVLNLDFITGVWKQNDPTLDVKCHSPEDDTDPNPKFGTRKTTTPLPVTVGLNAAERPKTDRLQPLIIGECHN